MTKLFRFLFHYARPLWRWYLGGLVTLGMTTYITLEIPEKAKTIVNSFSQDNDLESLSTIALLIILLGFIQMVTRALSRIFMFWPGRKIEAEVKNDLFTKLLYLPYQFYLSHGLGDVVSRIANDVNHLRVMAAFGVLQLLNVIFLLGFVLSKMLIAHPLLTFLCFIPMVLMIFVTKLLMPRMHQYSKYNQEALGELTNCVTEAYSNVHVIQANSANKSFLQRIEEKTFRVYDSNIKLIAVRTFLFPLMSCFTGLSKFIILIYGGYEVLNGRFTIGDILAFSIYIGVLVFPLTAVGILLSVYQRAMTALERMDDIFVQEEEQRESDEILYSEDEKNDESVLLSVKDLCFSFKESEHFSLKNVSFDLRRGEKVAVWGKIGSGKTTLFHLLTKIYMPPEGTVFLHKTDICKLDVRSYRRQIGYALQTAYVFSDSIEGNISFGTEADKEEIQIAARKAVIYDDVESFPETWETEVGEKGVRLSGGQKQRLSLARTLLRKTPLIILDDILSAVDQSTEKKLINSIFAVDQAILISSHRPSVLKEVDRILVLKEGKIIASGSFEEMSKEFPEMKQENSEETYEK